MSASSAVTTTLLVLGFAAAGPAAMAQEFDFWDFGFRMYRSPTRSSLN